MFNKTPYRDFMALRTQGTVTMVRESTGAGSDPLGNPPAGSRGIAPRDAAAAGTHADGI